jgi:DNA helicase-2/ATP-dependent DNA helicase PcrA
VKHPSTTEIDRQIDLLLAEQHELEQRIYEARFPVRIPASAFKDFIYDLPKVAEKYRRPLPEKPYKQTMAGTLFHGWVEARFGVLSGSDEIDAVEVPSEDEATTKTVEELRAIFEKSRFAEMKPFAIETEIQVTIRGNTFICKLDAVFETDDGYEIVDWKTGKPPVTEEEIAQRALQLALYRMAFTRLHGVDPEKVGVCLYYVADDLEIRPEHVQSADELLSMWDKVLEKLVV